MQSRASNRERFRVVGLFSSSFVRAPFIRASLMLLAVVGATLLFTGCGPKRVRADYKNYENSFAVTSNHEELLNLARLEQHDPTYFFKLGQISSSYRMEASLTGTGQVSTVASPPASVIPTGGGSPLALYENDPSFTLIPVTDDVNAQILLKPVDATVFYSLYLQNTRLDQLFRLTVNRIELDVPTPQGCQVEVIRNLPPPWFDANDKDKSESYQNDQFSLASYTEFLRVSAVIYALQKHGLLLLRGTSTFAPVDSASFIPNGPATPKTQEKNDTSAIDAAIKQANADKTPVSVSVTVAASTSGGGGDAAKNASAPAAKDFNDATAKNQVWELQGANANGQGGQWVLGSNTIQPQFQLTYRTPQESGSSGWASECEQSADPKSPPTCEYGRNVKTIGELLRQDFAHSGNGMRELLLPDGQLGPDIPEILEILYNGFSIEESSTDQAAENKLCSGASPDRISAHLVMRSLIGLMAAAAEEQKSFDKMQEMNPPVPAELGTVAMQTFIAAHLATTQQPPSPTETAQKLAALKEGQGALTNQAIPQIEQLPVLKLKWSDAELAKAQINKEELETLGLAVHYNRQNYLIDDPNLDDTQVHENVDWNRDMFRLISELSSQVSVDISKFPLPEVLQLRTE